MNLALENRSTTACAAILQLAPLDVPLHVEAAQALATGPVATACRGWDGEADAAAPLRMRVELRPALAGTGQTEMHVEGAVVRVRGPGVLAYAALDRGIARCAVSAAYLEQPTALRLEVLGPLMLMLLTRRDRTPLHASAFIADGLAVLLAGRSGAGKSCLARAADLAGLQVLSDDTVFVQLEPRLKVWGWPTAAHLLAQDVPGAAGPTRSRKGKVKQIVPLRSASPTAVSCDRAVLCFLSRETAPGLTRISATAVQERLWPLDEGFDLLPGPIAEAVARLSARGAWELRLSSQPAEAIRLLGVSLQLLRETAAT
jgi:hypothetical protein